MRRMQSVYPGGQGIYAGMMAKHLIDVDDEALRAARAELGTATIKETVNEALRRAAARREGLVGQALGVLAVAASEDRAEAWR